MKFINKTGHILERINEKVAIIA